MNVSFLIKLIKTIPDEAINFWKLTGTGGNSIVSDWTMIQNI